jgi:regulator of protease activity HflC (stomatin/prohibitin superfamily)
MATIRERYQRLKTIVRERTIGFAIVAVIVLFVVIYVWQRMFITILSGEAGVLWLMFLGGTKIDYIYPEGLHVIFPWDKMYVYEIRIQQTAHEFDVLTVNGLSLHLAISIRYYPEREMLGVLHQKVGPDYVNTVVIPEIESVLRVLIGRLRAEEVYTTEHSIIEKAVNTAIEQIAQRFIIVDNVIIKRIVFPPFIVDAIEKKMEQQQLSEGYEFRLERERKEAERKRIEAQGLRDYNQILTTSLSDQVLLWKGIQATLELSQSPNAKVVVIGSGKQGLPLIGNIPLESFANVTSLTQPVNTLGNVPEPAPTPTEAIPSSGESSAPEHTPEPQATPTVSKTPTGQP